MQTTAPWPTGVIARYLTAGDGTVDLSHVTRRHRTPDGIGEDRTYTTAACTGCPAATEISHVKGTHTYASLEKPDIDAADQEARAWAQEHAEHCRAMPRPGAA